MASINTPKACRVIYHFLGQHFICNVRQFWFICIHNIYIYKRDYFFFFAVFWFRCADLLQKMYNGADKQKESVNGRKALSHKLNYKLCLWAVRLIEVLGSSQDSFVPSMFWCPSIKYKKVTMWFAYRTETINLIKYNKYHALNVLLSNTIKSWHTRWVIPCFSCSSGVEPGFCI